ncbi:methyltransferase domain-containing protein [Myxococcaceae bacterium GXIMD 01537]
MSRQLPLRLLLCASLSLTGGCAHGPPPAAGDTTHASASHHGAMPHRFEDADAWAQRFEDPSRDAWQKPDQVVAALALPPDAKVADVGSGTGYFAVRLARAVPQGHVYGVDVEPDMARYLGERAQREHLSHLTPVVADAADARIPAPVDLVLVVDTFHHIGAREDYFRKLKGSLTPGGRLAIIDFRPGQPLGPPEAHKLAPEQVRRELEAAGWRFAEEHTFLPHQYFLVFRPG